MTDGKIDAKVQELRALHEAFRQAMVVLEDARAAYERAIREAQDIRRSVRGAKDDLYYLVLPVDESIPPFEHSWPHSLTEWELDKLNEETPPPPERPPLRDVKEGVAG